jgi:HSP20 family protein
MTEQSTLPARQTTRDIAALAPFNRLRDEIERLFDDLRLPASPRSLFSFDQRLMPAMDLTAADGGYRLSVELPGMQEDDIDIELADGVLTIAGEKRDRTDTEREGFLMSERRYGSFRRQLSLPVDVDPSTVKAIFTDGVLKIEMKKDSKAESRAKKIKIG